jgi:hypothetical protein
MELCMRAVVLLILVLSCVLLLAGFNALQGPAAIIVAAIAVIVLVVALAGGVFMRSRSGPQ